MRFLAIILSVLVFFLSSFAMAKNQVVYYQPKVVELTGIIKTLTFPGPPNYENINNGDRNETGSYLILKHPVDVDLVPNIGMGNDEPENNVKIFQLVVHNDSDWKKIKEYNFVRIKGALFRRIFGHHHARVLLDVKEITVLPKRKIVSDDLIVTQEDYAIMADPEQELKFSLKVMKSN